MSFRYEIFGFQLKSDLCLPELRPSESSFADVVIRRNRAGWDAPDEPTSGRYLHLSQDEAILAWTIVGHFRVRNGNEIIVDLLPEVDEALARLPLLSLVFSALLHQRRNFALHGSVVAAPEGAVAFLGQKGRGKSTLAAALCRRGYTFVADDIVAFATGENSVPIVLPAFPSQKLWPDALAAIGENPEAMARLHGLVEKRKFSVAEQQSHQPQPLRAIYILKEGTQPEIVPIQPQKAVIQLLQNLSMAPFADQLTARDNQFYFQQCVEVVRHVPVYHLARPESLDLLDDFIGFLTEHLHADLGLEKIRLPNG